jgi:hypothetical protein
VGSVAGPNANLGQAYNANSGYTPGGGASGGCSGSGIPFAAVGGTGGYSLIVVREYF